jgi:uncharacterized protein
MAQPGPTCPICGKATVAAFRPFCSKRCADVDLSRWLHGVYAIPATEQNEDDEEGSEGGEPVRGPWSGTGANRERDGGER